MVNIFTEALRNALKNAISALGYEITKRKSVDTEVKEMSFLEGVLECMLLSYPRLQFLQIGANDGVTNDPIYRFVRTHSELGSIVLVEPQPELQDELRNNYKNQENVKILSCAIDGHEAFKTLYRIKPEYWDRYKGITGSGVSAFRKQYLIQKTKLLPRHIYSDTEDAIEAICVPCCKLDDVLTHLEYDSAVVLQVDTEGHDDKVIYTLDLRKKMPIVINYEYSHLSNGRLESLHAYLKRSGYCVTRWSASDELAILSGVANASSR